MAEHIGTTCVQGGYRPGDAEPRQVPIYQSTTWKYDTSEHMGKLFDLEESGYFYTRLQNPTNDAVAAKICELEGGTAAMLTSSGQAANFFAVFNIAGAGDHVVASSAIYGGGYNLLVHTMRRMGLECTFVAPNATDEELEAAFRPNTKCVFGETIANPALAVLDIERFAAAAHAHGVPLIVDNTFPTPVNCRPIEWGADIVTHSTTKYMDGHGAAVGGAIVDSGRFDWTAHADKFPGLTTPDESYHGVVYTERFGLEGAFITKATAQLMRDRIRFALDIVDALGHKQVVLGAWGCGVFGWEAELVSELFREELASGSHGIELAIFAVPRDCFNENLACFEHALSTFPERNRVSFADALAERRAAEQAAAAAEEDDGEEDDWRKYL